MSESDALYARVRSRIDRQLSPLPRFAILNAILFTLFTVPFGLISMVSRPMGGMNGVIYWIIFSWSVFLFIHVALRYVNSGAAGHRREKVIYEEVKDAGDSLGIDEDEMIQMHLQLAEDVRKDAWVFRRLMWNATGNLLLWPGVLVLLVLLGRGMPNLPFMSLIETVFYAALLGTLLLGFTLPVRQLFKRPPADDMARLRGLYGYRQKRKVAPDMNASARLVELGDDGELILDSDPAQPGVDGRSAGKQ